MLTCLQLEKSGHVVDGGEQKDREDESFRLDDLLLTKEGATHRDVAKFKRGRHLQKPDSLSSSLAKRM